MIYRVVRRLRALVPAGQRDASSEPAATLDFDGLIETLQSAVSAAQQRVAARCEEALRRRLDSEEREADSEASAHFLNVLLDAPGAAAAARIRVPLSALCPPVMPQITMAALEFDAAIEETPARDTSRKDAPPAAPLALVLERSDADRPMRRQLHRIRISLTGPQPGAGEITVDGIRLRRLGADAPP